MRTRSTGFSLVEIIIVLAILSLLVLMSSLLTSVMLGRNQADNVTSDVLTTLRRAQWQSMNGHENNQWGVHFESDEFTLFRGTSYSVSDPNNVVTTLPNDVNITGVALTGGGVNVVFDDAFGGTTQDGTITIEHLASSETRTVTVNTAGGIDWN